MEKFKIPLPASKSPSKIVHIRFPANIVEAVNKEIDGKNCTFSAFIVEAVRFALYNLETKTN